MMNFYEVRKYCDNHNSCTDCIYWDICDTLVNNLKLTCPFIWTDDLIELLNNSVYANEKISDTTFKKFIEKRFNEVK